MSERILLVEDDRALRETLCDALEDEGYETITAPDGNRGADLAFSRRFDLVILDLMLPGKGGFEILREIRAHDIPTPVLLLTVRNDENDKVLGFELGADDYVTKPFGLRELLARVRSLLRRAQPKQEKTSARAQVRIGETEVDLGTYELRRGDENQTLSKKEAGILRLLLAEQGRVVPRAQFLDDLWGDDAAVSNRTVDTHVMNLRLKLEPNPSEPQFILTVHGVGYRLATEI